MRLRRKICLLGAPGVGKTSLARRFADGVFEPDYESTLSMAIFQGALGLDDVYLGRRRQPCEARGQRQAGASATEDHEVGQ